VPGSEDATGALVRDELWLSVPPVAALGATVHRMSGLHRLAAQLAFALADAWICMCAPDVRAWRPRPRSDRREVMSVATPERAADLIRGYMALGFGGFTFANTQLPTVESVHQAGEVLKLLDAR
jgi:alkanesulfonate monooxygenase SsuD/methylene tetrahydromethanopterin reductase-like flavin-dependent oxidoreductase (luciferase family)